MLAAMTSTVHRFGAFLARFPFGDALLEKLPEGAREVLREIREAASEPRDADVHRGDVKNVVRAVTFSIGPVREGGVVSAVDVLKGPVDGGTVRAVNLLLGDVLHGEVRAVNVIVGDVHGGVLRDIHLIVGDVHGGRLERCFAVIGDVLGGEGSVARVVGRASGAVQVGERLDG